MNPSWVIWFFDGRYAYAWGETAEAARANYLKEWSEGIDRVVPASEHPNQLPPQNYVPTVSAKLRGVSLEEQPALYNEKGERHQ